MYPFETIYLFNPVKSLHTTYFGIHFSLLANNRHIIRCHLENDTWFAPKKVWNGKSYVEEEQNLRLHGPREHEQRRKREALERLWLACHLVAKGKSSQAFLSAQR